MKKLVVLDLNEQRKIIRRRRALGLDRYDEVWNGVYVMSPVPNPEHQDLATRLASAFVQVVGDLDQGRVQAGTNVSDRRDGWEKNYRCPDVAVFLPTNPAVDCGSHWCGGPDLAVEILSRRDRSRKKFAFYARVKVRELLLLDRRPWRLELYRLRDDVWEPVGQIGPDDTAALVSQVLPVRFRLVTGSKRPQIEVTTLDGARRWLA